jgi:hypothetical protein
MHVPRKIEENHNITSFMNWVMVTTTTTKPFYSQVSWSWLEMKPHEKKK